VQKLLSVLGCYKKRDSIKPVKSGGELNAMSRVIQWSYITISSIYKYKLLER
jgi:hypothetical protein